MQTRRKPMRAAGWLMGFVAGVVCLVTATDVWAQCPLVVEHDFVGGICPNSIPGRCLEEPGVRECRFGRWLLQGGGVLEGSKKIFFVNSSSTTEGPRDIVTSQGFLRTPTFEGRYESTATKLAWSRAVVWTEFETTEKRTGTE